jgi:hypothetical protein
MAKGEQRGNREAKNRPEGHRKEVGGLHSRLQMADRVRLAWLQGAL